MSMHCSPKIITDNLLVYLDAANQKSYPNYGLNKWGDLSRNGNHFFMQGNLINDTKSFLFPGNTANYFYSEQITNPITELTVEIWTYSNTNTTSDALYSFVSNDSITIYHGITDQSNLTMYGPNSSIASNKSILNDQWNHVVRTSRRSTGVEKLYLNGTIEYQGILDPNINFNQMGFVLLGQRPINGVLDVNYSYAGKIAIFKIYSKVLTDNEIKQNFNALKGRFFL